jgi:hypothetical protein
VKHTLLVVSCLSLGLGAAAGCGGKVQTHAHAGRAPQSSMGDDCVGGFARNDAASQPRLRGPALANYNKGYVDGANASAFFNKGQPLTDQQVDRLIEIGRRQGDPTGLLALNGYPDGYRAGAKHSGNPYEKQMSAEQVAQVRKARGLPPEPVQVKPDVSKRANETHASNAGPDKKQRREDRKESRKSKKESAEASARD